MVDLLLYCTSKPCTFLPVLVFSSSHSSLSLSSLPSWSLLSSDFPNLRHLKSWWTFQVGAYYTSQYMEGWEGVQYLPIHQYNYTLLDWWHNTQTNSIFLNPIWPWSWSVISSLGFKQSSCNKEREKLRWKAHNAVGRSPLGSERWGNFWPKIYGAVPSFYRYHEDLSAVKEFRTHIIFISSKHYFSVKYHHLLPQKTCNSWTACIPHICHGSHGYTRVKFFWPV